MDELFSLEELARDWMHDIGGLTRPVVCWIHGNDGFVFYESGHIEELIKL